MSSRASSPFGKTDNIQVNKHKGINCLHAGNEQGVMVESDGGGAGGATSDIWGSLSENVTFKSRHKG